MPRDLFTGQMEDDNFLGGVGAQPTGEVPRDLFQEAGIKMAQGGPENPFMSAMYGIDTGVKRVARGALQPLVETGLFGQNAINNLNKAREQQEGFYQHSLAQNPISAQSGQVLGNIAGNAPMFALPGGVLSKYLTNPYALSVLTGLTGGALSGAAEETGPEDSRLLNSLFGGGVGAALGVLPGIGSLVPGAVKGSIKYGKSLPKAFSKKDIAERIARTDYGKAQSEFSRRFANLKEGAKEYKVGDINPPRQIEHHALWDNMKGKNKTALKRYKIDPSYENAHQLDKRLGKLVRQQEDYKFSKSPLYDEDKLHIYEVSRKKLQGSIDKAFKKAGAPELAEEYRQINKDWIKDVKPYRIPPIHKYRRGELTDADFLKKLHQNDLWRATHANRYPEANVNRLLNPAELFRDIIKGSK